MFVQLSSIKGAVDTKNRANGCLSTRRAAHTRRFDKQETRKAQLFTGQLNVRRKHRKCGAAEIGHPFVCLKLEGSENVIKVNQTLKVEVKTRPVKRAFLSTECRPALK